MASKEPMDGLDHALNSEVGATPAIKAAKWPTVKSMYLDKVTSTSSCRTH